ncbi:MurR/RpiR family transcriptional regulator [Robbsia sp. KACC 23696]|uniref:MurR/RpiR family transcriptional regulator n=1 Tax=Robbsia sp. KACC 23696 TaxID=3149231 RepID=UPI00325BD828
MTKTEQSFVSRIRAHLQALPSAERRLAEFVLDFPGDLASYTGAELSALADVSPATVSRFVRRLGYETYEEARRHVRDEKNSGSPLFLTAGDRHGDDSPLEAHALQGAQNLTSTFARLSPTMIDEVARAIVDARRVLVVGYRSSQAFASYFRWQIHQVVEQAIALPGPGETVGEYLASLEARDIVVLFGLRRRVPQTDSLLDHLAVLGVKTLYITDQYAPAHRGATWTIHCDTAAPGPLDNHAAVIGLCGLLATRIFAEAGNQGRRRLSAIESAHDAMGEM